MRSLFVEVSGGHLIRADGDSPWLPGYVVFEVAPDFWTDSLTCWTLPGHE